MLLQDLSCFSTLSKEQEQEQELQPPVDRLWEAGKKILFTLHFINRIALSNFNINGLLVDLGIILFLIS
jgi:hypothetical protein